MLLNVWFVVQNFILIQKQTPQPDVLAVIKEKIMERTIREVNNVTDFFSEVISQIRDIAESYYSESPFIEYGRGFNEESFIRNWDHFFSIGVGFFFMVFEENLLVGYIGCVKTEDVMSGIPIVTEVCRGVKKGQTGKGVGTLLIQRLEELSKSVGVKLINVAGTNNKRWGTQKKFFTKLGFRLVGYNLLKGV